jgi:hypothetical protein
MPLEKPTIASAEPRKKPFKLFDGKWLYLVVCPSGLKFWRLEFNLRGKERTLRLGDYPGMTLEAAREKRNEALLAMSQGRDFVHEWKAAQVWQRAEARHSFKFVALDFLSQGAGHWPERRRENSARCLEAHIFPVIGERPLSQIEPGEVLAAVLRISAGGQPKVAASIRALCIQVFRHGVSRDSCSRASVAALRTVLHAQNKRQQ